MGNGGQRQQQEPLFDLAGLTLPEVEVIMGALLERPMKDVVQLFGKLQGQMKAQMEAAQQPQRREASSGNGVDKDAATDQETAAGECQPSAPRRRSSAGTR